MTRWPLLIGCLLAVIFTASADAKVVRGADGQPLSCPDPSVIRAHVGRYDYYLVCTSDADPDALPIRASNDLVHWQLLGYVLPAGHQPWWALPSPQGRYWAPSLYRIRGRWVVYFAAEYNPETTHLHATGSWVLGVAWSSSIHGPWHNKLLHYRGQFNALPGVRHENYGGVIDPSLVSDPRSGQQYLIYAEQHTSIWAADLSADGLSIDSHIHLVMWIHSHGWECAGGCTVEGPVAYYRDGWFYLFYSGASTWSGTYAVGVAIGRDPMHGIFRRLSQEPVLRSGSHWIGPGGQSAPVTGPDGHDYLFYHAESEPDTSHDSAARYLLVSRIDWTGLGGYYPLINDGRAG